MAYKSSNTKLITKPSIKRPSVSMKPSIDNNQLQVGFTPDLQNFNKAQANSEKIILNRDVFNREAFSNTVNTNFSQLDQEAPDLSFFDPNLATVGDFFTIYNNLFYQIPKGTTPDGPQVNTHQFLIERSTEYTKFIAQQEEIIALTEEITDLRAQNLELVADMANIVEGFEQTVSQLTEQLNANIG